MNQSNKPPLENDPLKFFGNNSIFSKSPTPVDSILFSLKNVDPGSRRHHNIFDKSVMNSLTSAKNSLYISTLDLQNQLKSSALRPPDSKCNNYKKEIDISHLSGDELLEVYFFLQ